MIYLVLLFWSAVFGATGWHYRKAPFMTGIVEVYQSAWAGEDKTDVYYRDSAGAAGTTVGIISIVVLIVLIVAACIWSIVWAL